MHEVSFVLFELHFVERLSWESHLKIIDEATELQNAVICCHIVS